jgi:hypothetical protein
MVSPHACGSQVFKNNSVRFIPAAALPAIVEDTISEHAMAVKAFRKGLVKYQPPDEQEHLAVETFFWIVNAR